MKHHKNISKVLLLLLLTATSLSSYAYDFYATAPSGQRLYFNILTDSTVEVTYPNYYNGSYYYAHSRPTGSLVIPASVTNSSTQYHVVAIGSNAFRWCTGLTAITIPSSVTVINDGAFNHCTGVSSFVVPDSVISIGVGAFQSCTGLHTVQLGSLLSIIGNVAFDGCTNLSSVQIPNSVTMMGNWAFSNCTGLHYIGIGSSITQIAYNVFSGCNNVYTIHYNAVDAVCSYMTSSGYMSSLPINALNKLVIGDSVQTIQPYTFLNASSLDTVIIGQNVATIHNHAFQGCNSVHYLEYNAVNCADSSFAPAEGATAGFRPFTQLSTLVLGDSVQRIPSHSFSGFNFITSLTLPQSLLSIGDNAFQNCSHITSTLQFPASLQTIGNGAFRNCDSIYFLNTGNSPAPIPANAFNDCDRLFQVTIGSNTLSVGDSAFRNCSRLTSVTFGSSLSSIGANAFDGCVRLTTPAFPDSLVSIAAEAFYGCSLLGGQITFPATVTSIGNNAFSNTAVLSVIEMLGSMPPTIYSNTFASATSATQVRVPCGAVMAYLMADYWNDFNNLSEAIPYRLTLNVNNADWGTVSVIQQPTCSNPVARIQATANTDYHFIRWSDGIATNPRNVTLSSDTVFTAVFVSDNSYITVTCNDSTRGTVSGSGLYNYYDTVMISATAFADYHFQCWSDGNTSNPRYIFASQDSTFTAIFLSNNATITVLNNNPGMGTVSGGGNYYYQDQVVISATPNYGHHFTMWNDGSTINPRTVLVSQDSTFIANFAVNLYTVSALANNSNMGTVTGGGSYAYLTTVELTATASQGHHFVQWSDSVLSNPRSFQVVSDTAFIAQFAPNSYTVTVASGDTTLGTVSGGGTYSYGSTAFISAAPVYGCHFVQWSDGNPDNPRSLTVTGNISLTAQFAVNNYTLTVISSNSTMGTVSGGGTYAHNTSVYISAQANHGYHFVQWNDSVTTNPRQIVVSSNATYTAIFALNSYSITAVSGNAAYGTVSGSGNYDYSSTATLTATPFNGYHFVQWNDGNTDNPRTIVVTADTSYTAIFAINNYTVTASPNLISAGTVIGGGNYNYQSVVTLTAQAAAHYHFAEWSDGITANPRTLTVTSDTLLTAIFYPDTHLVMALSADTLRGYVSGAGLIAYGSTDTLTAIPHHGYYFSSWSDGITQNPRMVTVVSDTAFTALFLPNIYSLQVSSSDTLMGSVSGSGLFDYMSEAIVTATALPHYYFVSWNDGVTTNPRRLTVTRDSSIVALFQAEPRYMVTVLSNDNQLGATTGTGQYFGGEEVTIYAAPNTSAHAVFKYWDDGVTTNPRTVRVLSNCTYKAIFALQSFNVTLTSANPEMGAVYGGGEYDYGSEATLLARPFPGYAFRKWSDGDTHLQRTVTVTRNITLQAIFYNAVGIDGVDSLDINVLTCGHEIVVQGASGRAVSLYDIMGRRIAIAQRASDSETLRVPAAGVYLLQVEGLKARKLIVR